MPVNSDRTGIEFAELHGAEPVELSGSTSEMTEELDRLAKFYKASTLVVLRRIFDAELISQRQFRAAYQDELERVLAIAADRSPGGNFYNTLPVRVSKRFARALISDTKEGHTLYRDAFHLLGSKPISAFEELGERLGVD